MVLVFHKRDFVHNLILHAESFGGATCTSLYLEDHNVPSSIMPLLDGEVHGVVLSKRSNISTVSPLRR